MQRGRLTVALGILLLCLGRPVAAEEDPAVPSALAAPSEPLAAEVVREAVEREARIGEIFLRLDDIFDLDDPRENRRLYRLANRLHRSTRPWVIEQQLLFAPGDLFAPQRLEESERLLRQNRYLYDAEVVAVTYHREANRVDVLVRARNVWTLTGGVQVDRSGGENTVGFEIQDTNLLGTGKDLELERRDEVDRTVRQVRYRDPNILGTRFRGEAVVADNSDGETFFVEVERPFFALDTRWALGAEALDDERISPRYELGEITDRFRRGSERFEAFWGTSEGFVDGRAGRRMVGFTHHAERFEPAPGRPPPKILPEDRVLAYPWVGYASVSGRYEKLHDLDQIGRTEDLRLGLTWSGRLGWVHDLWGADRNGVILDLRGEWGKQSPRGSLTLAEGSLAGRYTRSRVEDLHLSARLRHYRRHGARRLFFASIGLDVTERLDAEDQLLLGGDSGLRGYPLRYQSGDHAALLTLEERFFTDWYPFRLAYVGGAVFLDAGRTWTDDPAALNQGLLVDLGLGLRFALSRSGLGSVVHVDVAFPLGGDPSIDDIQWLVNTKRSF